MNTVQSARDRRGRAALLGVVTALVLAVVMVPPVGPHPAGAQEPERVFPEPEDSSDFITRGPKYAPEQFKEGMLELERRHGRYLNFTTIREEMGDPNAVSVGEDGVPAWDPDDTGDGLDFYVVTVTDSQSPVPDEDKGYVLFTAAHAGEFCGREATPRFFEDLVRLADTAPDTVLQGGTGIDGTPLELTVAEALERTKLLFVDVAPDGWVAGERDTVQAGPGVVRPFSQSNGAGVNGNRVAYQDGWVFPDDEVIRGNGYSTMTQPEGIAATRYLREVRETELEGRPFATSMDWHGPLPVGALLFHDQGNDPAKLDRVHDLAERITQRAYGVLADYATESGAEIHSEFAGSADDARLAAFTVWQQVFGGVDEKALYLTLNWNEYATAWDHIDYTVSSTFGGWAASESGLGADGFSHEMPCQALGWYWEPQTMQLYVDNIRAMSEAMVVHAAFRNDREVVTQHDLGGTIGFVDHGRRVRLADGNPSPPPTGERSPLIGELEQAPYDVANTDYFRDLRKVTPTSIVQLAPEDLSGDLSRLDTLVIADATVANSEAVRTFAASGGNVVLTDSALRMLPAVIDAPEDAVRDHFSYVGYADLDREHPWTDGLYERARQMFDPVGLGYPLLMERDQYWPCGQTGDCEESITQNSAPMWTVDREAWESAGGVTVATADPPEDRKSRYEGTDEDKTIIGTMPVGEGRLVIFGGLLPQPSEDYPHWFGLNSYTISVAGQELLFHGLTWDRARPTGTTESSDGAPDRQASATSGRAMSTPATGGGSAAGVLGLVLAGAWLTLRRNETRTSHHRARSDG